ncbi:hypothetical protein [Jatrophihabitans sp.]|uniref:hypothetical protein n=1 Tax=Jatrophihabitans sp. TaxID=1932789 RepID=UPI0030C6E7F1
MPAADTVANGLGLGRVAIGVGFLADPISSVRVLGVDTGSAKRMTFLARMAAGRDIVLGLGVLLARSPESKAGWVAAGAGADVVDAVAISAGMRSGTTGGAGAAGISAGALGAALVGFWAARGLRARG